MTAIVSRDTRTTESTFLFLLLGEDAVYFVRKLPRFWSSVHLQRSSELTQIFFISFQLETQKTCIITSIFFGIQIFLLTQKYKGFSEYIKINFTHHNHHHHHHHISVMELGHLLTRSGLTYPEVSSKVSWGIVFHYPG